MCGNEKSVFLQPQKRETLFERQTQSQADIAQLVEQLICNQPVGGSSPSIGSKFLRGSRIAAIATDCKSVLFGVRWFESTLPHKIAKLVLGLAVVAHLVERQPSKLQVAGSRPVYRSNEKNVHH